MSDTPTPEIDPTSPSDSRLASLRKEVSSAIEKRDATVNLEKKAQDSVNGKNMGVALRMASEFTSAIIVGAFLGFGADAVFKSSPWGLLICLPIGFAAGVLNVIRAAQKMAAEAPKGQDLPPEKDEEDN